MSKKNFKEFICRPFCRFFREDQKEEMACRGALLIQQMVRSKRLDPASFPRTGKEPALWKTYDPVLVAHVCQNCSFQKEDCDFQSVCPPPDAEPCGGYILLILLIKKGLLSTRDLKGLSNKCQMK